MISFLDNSRRKYSFSFKTQMENTYVGQKQNKYFANTFEQLSEANSNVRILNDSLDREGLKRKKYSPVRTLSQF